MFVDLIDKAWKIGGDVFESFVIYQIDGLDLEGFHKALGLGIVIGNAMSAHRADDPVFGQQVGIMLRRIEHDSSGGCSPSAAVFLDSRLQCRNSNANVDRATNRAADDAARPGVKIGGQIDEPPLRSRYR